MSILVEVCAGSIKDCMIAQKCGADRIELNSGLALGGLTPSFATLKMVKRTVTLPIMSMVRPRGGGFCYDAYESAVMFEDARNLIELGSEGIVFGFLKEDFTIHTQLTKEMVDLCHASGREAVFHRAFDVVKDPFKAVEDLIRCGVDRILTSGLEDKAIDGTDLLKELHTRYGDRIEIVIGSGVSVDNVETLVRSTGINQVHGSFKQWFSDPTSSSDKVSYAYSNEGSFDGVSKDKLREFINKVGFLLIDDAANDSPIS